MPTCSTGADHVDVSLIAIEVEAFRNFAGRAELRVADLPPGLHLVRGINRANPRLGSNGSGKSTFFSDAVSWCLDGKTAGGLRTTDVRSWLTKKAPRVALTLRAGDGEVVVQRGPRATELSIGGEVVGQEDVYALVGTPAITRAVVWGQGQPLFFDLPPRDKMALLSDTLGLERWDMRAEAASARAGRLEVAAAELDGELRGLEAAMDGAADDLRGARARADEWGADHAERIKRAGERASAALEGRDRAEAALGEVDFAADAAGTTAKDMRASVDELDAKIREMHAISGRAGGALAAARQRAEQVERQLEALGGNSARCPTCGRVLPRADSAQARRDLKVELKARGADVARAAREAEDLDAELTRDEDLRASIGARARDLEADEERLASERRSAQRTASDARAELMAAEEALSAIEAEGNPHRDATQRARSRLKAAKRDLAAGEERAKKYAASIERARFWARGFRDVRLMIVDEFLDDLRGTTAAVLEDLGLGGWEVDYATERETKSGTVQRALRVSVRAPGSPDGVRWEVYSGGEGQRLRLAGALALGEALLGHAGVRVDFRVLDEPTRGLSPEGVRDLTEMLSAYAEEAGLRLFYVDHQSVDGLTFASAITVEGEPGGATVRTE